MNKLATLLCASVLTIAASTGPVAAQNPNAQKSSAEAWGPPESVVNNCAVVSVAAFPDRVHILCLLMPALGGPGGSKPSSGAVRFFAVENNVATNAMALAVLSVANLAVQGKRSLTITYRTNPNENPAGCHVSDCRRIVSVVVN